MKHYTKIALILVGLTITIVTGCKRQALPPVGKNTLAVGTKSKLTAPTTLSFARPISLNGVTSEQLGTLRRQFLDQVKDTIEDQYEIWPGLLGRVDSQNHWASSLAIFLQGLKDSCGEGDSYDALTLLNPLTLISPRILGLSPSSKSFKWNKSKVTIETAQQPSFPLYPKPLALQWDAQKSSARLTIDLTTHLNRLDPLLENPFDISDAWFNLSAINARDFGFIYIALPPSQAKNIEFKSPSNSAFRIFEAVSYRDIYQGSAKCNTIQTQIEMRGMKITQLPAEVTAYLWKAAPTDPSTRPDFIFTIYFL